MKSSKTLTKWLAVVLLLAFLMRSHLPPEARAFLVLPRGMVLSVVLWLAFSVYWTYAAKVSAPAKASESGWSRLLHLILMDGAMLLLLLPIPGLSPRFLPNSHSLVYAGLVIQGAFLWMAVWARWCLGKNWSGEVRIATGHQLVRTGPYRFLRHPIYTAVLGMHCGTMLVSGEIHALLALMLVTVAYWRKIRLEERVLGETFGAAYDAYRRDTWALVPLIY